MTTGRFVFTFADDLDAGEHVDALRAAGLSTLVRSTDFSGSAVDADQTRDADGVVFSGLGVAVVSAEPGQVTTMQSADEPRILSVEPERVHHALTDSVTGAYAAGFTHGAADHVAGPNGVPNTGCRITGTTGDRIVEEWFPA